MLRHERPAREVEEAPAANQHRAFDPFHAEVHDAVADGSRVDRQPAVILEERAHCVGQGADAELERSALRDPGGGVRADRLFPAGALGRRQGCRWPGALNHQREVFFSENTLAVRPRHLVIDLCSHDAGGVDGGEQVVGCKAHAVLAAGVGWTYLQHDHVATDLPAADEPAQLRVRYRQDLEHPCLGEDAHLADGAVGAKAQMVGVLGLDDAGVARAEEEASAGEPGALRDQGLEQCLRLRAGLPADDSVAGTNDTSQVHHAADYDRRPEVP